MLIRCRPRDLGFNSPRYRSSRRLLPAAATDTWTWNQWTPRISPMSEALPGVWTPHSPERHLKPAAHCLSLVPALAVCNWPSRSLCRTAWNDVGAWGLVVGSDAGYESWWMVLGVYSGDGWWLVVKNRRMGRFRLPVVAEFWLRLVRVMIQYIITLTKSHNPKIHNLLGLWFNTQEIMAHGQQLRRGGCPPNCSGGSASPVLDHLLGGEIPGFPTMTLNTHQPSLASAICHRSLCHTKVEMSKSQISTSKPAE